MCGCNKRYAPATPLPGRGANPPPSGTRSSTTYHAPPPTATHVSSTPRAVATTRAATATEPNMEVTYWGPRKWKLLHTLAERIGKSGSAMADNDAAIAMNFIINNLPLVLPCHECSTHASTYLLANKFNAAGKMGTDLQNYVRDYLFTFHNSVSGRKSQPQITKEEYSGLYKDYVQKDSDELRDSLRRAVFYRIIKSDNYMNWAMKVHKLKLSLGMPS